MKKINKFLVILPFIFLSGCSGNENGDGYQNVLPENKEDGNILHAFNWTYNEMKNALPAIAESGFKTIQTSPVQQPKSGGTKWEFLYQPVSFSIGTSSPLGTKEELKELCEEADNYGISIICDMVFNHMATTGEIDENGFYVVDPEVEEYEPEIYANLDETFHRTPKNKLGNLGSVTQWYDGLPDLNTSNSLIQEKCLGLMKECIDVGVDGFRFDAAKHIETPTDSEFASDFWDNTLEVAKEYYKEKNNGEELFAYGEILNTVDGGRDISAYTKYMKVTDNTFISSISQGYAQAKGEMIASAQYQKETDASNLVTWAESHDTFAHSTHASTNDEIKLYSCVATRKDSRALYLARPYESNGTIQVGTIGSYYFEDARIGEANRFHNRFVGCDEYLHGEDSLYICERYSESDQGAYILNLIPSNTDAQEVTFSNLKDGTYFDELTNKKYVVKNGKTKIAFSKDAEVFLTKSNHKLRPKYTFSSRDCTYLQNFDLTIEVENAKEASYIVDGGDEVKFSKTTTIRIGENKKAREVTEIEVKATNGEVETKRVISFTKFNLVSGGFNIFNLNETYLTNYELYLWSWNDSGSLWNKDYEYDEDNKVLLVSNNGNYTGFLLALFEKGYEVSNLTTWDSKVIKQSKDISFADEYYDASSF